MCLLKNIMKKIGFYRLEKNKSTRDMLLCDLKFKKISKARHFKILTK